jgi:ferredoxin-nitrite reductase
MHGHTIGFCSTLGKRTLTEGYHVYLGGVAASVNEQAIAREYATDVPFQEVPVLLERLLALWLARRATPQETFSVFCLRHSMDGLRAMAAVHPPS